MATRALANRCFNNLTFQRFTFTNLTRGYPKITGKVESFSAESIQTGELNSFTKNVGDWVNEGELIAKIETEKTTLDFNSVASGVLTKTLSNPGDTLRVGSELYEIDTDAPRPAGKAEAPKAEAKAETPKAEAAKAPKTEAKKEESKPISATVTSNNQPPAGVPSTGRETRVKMTLIRRRIAERLKLSQNTAALLTTFQECDMHNLMELRNDYKDQFATVHGVKLGFMSGFVKASATALLEHRLVNAYIDESDIVYRDYVDISVAVATPKGLVTPVLRDCDKMSFADVEKEIAALGVKARNNQITPNDLSGGTFTISNGGVYGSLMGTPIVNPPQSAILGMHAIVPRPVVVNNQITIRPMMYLALTYDHRLLDGKDAVTFLKSIKEKVEDPRRLLLGL